MAGDSVVVATIRSSPRSACAAFARQEALDDLELESVLYFFMEPLEVRPTSGGQFKHEAVHPGPHVGTLMPSRRAQASAGSR